MTDGVSMDGLVLRGLCAGYRGRRVLRGVDLEVRPGQIVALVGTNGAGKSTLLRALSGGRVETVGSARFGDLDLLRATPRARARRLAVVPQSPHLPGELTAFEVVLLGRYPHAGRWGGETAADREAARRSLASVGVDDLRHRRIAELSGGERQRVLLARALAQEAGALLLDEATAHLDLHYRAKVLELVRELAGSRELCVLATFHDLNFAARFADRVAILHEGVIAAFGPADAVIEGDRVRAIWGPEVEVFPHPRDGRPVVLPRVDFRPPGREARPGGASPDPG